MVHGTDVRKRYHLPVLGSLDGSLPWGGRWTKPSKAPDGIGSPQRFRVTHPFHPWHGREWELVTYQHNRGEDRVYFHDNDGRLQSLPAAWTSVFEVDAIVVQGAGRAPFRAIDLLELATLIVD